MDKLNILLIALTKRINSVLLTTCTDLCDTKCSFSVLVIEFNASMQSNDYTDPVLIAVSEILTECTMMRYLPNDLLMYYLVLALFLH